jgi:hypothetical protein
MVSVGAEDKVADVLIPNLGFLSRRVEASLAP